MTSASDCPSMSSRIEEPIPIDLLEPVDLRDARVIEGGEDLRLTLEARDALGIAREGLGQRFDGDVAAEARVPGAVDLTHAAGPERGDHVIGTDTGAGRQRHVESATILARTGGYGFLDDTYARMFTRSSLVRLAATAFINCASSPFLVPFWKSYNCRPR